MTVPFPSPVLSLTVDHVKDLHGSDALFGLWHVFTQCKYALRDGERLENISWRLWYREHTSKPAKAGSTYRPPTPDDASPSPEPTNKMRLPKDGPAWAAPIPQSHAMLPSKPTNDDRSPESSQRSSAERASRSMMPSPESSISSGSSSQDSPSPPFFHPVTLSTSPAPGPDSSGNSVGKIICECIASSAPVQSHHTFRLGACPPERRRNHASKSSDGSLNGRAVAIVRLDSSADSSGTSVRIALPISSKSSPKSCRIASNNSSKSSTPSSNSDRSSFPRVVVVNSTPNRTPHPTPPATPTTEIVEPRYRIEEQPAKVSYGDNLCPPALAATMASEMMQKPQPTLGAGQATATGLTSPVASPVTPAHVLTSTNTSTPAHSPSTASPKPISDKGENPNVQPSKAAADLAVRSVNVSSDTSEASTTAPETVLSTATLSTVHTSPPVQATMAAMRRSKSEGGSKRPPLAVEEDEEVIEDDDEEATTAPSTSVHSAGHMKKLSAKHGKRIATARYPRHKRIVRRSTGSEKEKEKEAQKERLLEFAAQEREKQERLLQLQRQRDLQEQREKERAVAKAKERERLAQEEMRFRREQELQKERDRAAQIKRDAQEREAAARRLAETKRIVPRPDRPPSPSRTPMRKSRFDIGSPQSDDSKSTISPARETIMPSRPVIGGLAGLLHAAPHEQPSTHRTLPPPRRSPDQVPQGSHTRVPTAPALESTMRTMTEADVTPRPPTVRAPTSRDLPPPNVLAEALKQQGQRQQPPRKVVQLEEANDSSTEDESDWEDEQDSEVEAPPPPPPPLARANQPRRPPLTSSKSTNNVLDAAAQKLQHVQSDKELFTKLPSRSYSNLAQQPRTGLLSQLMKPDQKINEMRRTQTMVDVRGGAAPPPLLHRPPVMEKSKSAAALPMSSVSTSQAVVGMDAKPAASAAPQHGGGYRPKGRPQNEDLESDTDKEEEDGGDRVELSQSVAQQRLAALVGKGKKPTPRSSSDTASSHAHEPLPPVRQQRRPRIQPMTSVNPSRAPSPSRTLTETRSPPSADPSPAAPIPLGYPYNLPPPPEPSSPRTTRQLMLRTEMSESVRQNLLWSRQLARRDNMGPPRTRSGILEQPAVRPAIAAQPSVVRLTAPRQQDPMEQQQEQEDIRREMRLARNRTWAGDEYHHTGWW